MNRRKFFEKLGIVTATVAAASVTTKAVAEVAADTRDGGVLTGLIHGSVDCDGVYRMRFTDVKLLDVDPLIDYGSWDEVPGGECNDKVFWNEPGKPEALK